MILSDFLDLLVCPHTGGELEIVPGDIQYKTIERSGKDVLPIGCTENILKVIGADCAYPIIEDMPVLLAPELLAKKSSTTKFEKVDLNDLRYAEAYEEMSVYNKICDSLVEKAVATGDDRELCEPMGAIATELNFDEYTFPYPEDVWVDAKHDGLSQLEAYAYLAPLTGKVFVQLGGSGSHAIKALLAGAKKAFLLTPMIGEARVARYLAKKYGVEDKFGCVIGIGEEIPFTSESVDVVYSGGCFHHMRTDYTAKELHRILKSGGKFSGVDPWKTPLHTIGTKLIGKREKSVFCKPINPERLQPMKDTFVDLKVINHGPILRYLFLALDKFGVRFSVGTMLKICSIDEKIARISKTTKFGGSLLLAGTKK